MKMIKLKRALKPEYLTDDKVKELTEEFKKDKSKVIWKTKSIGDALLKSSSYKCAYCECELQKEDSYMQVEHFKDKDKYPDDVVKWENLLPSCGRCNRKKWTLDVNLHPIVNPYDDDPKFHLKQQAFRLYGKDLKGENTVEKLYLNDDERVVYSRFVASNEISRQLSELAKISSNLDQLRNGMTKLLQACQSNRPYSAFTAYTLHSDKDYEKLKNLLLKNNLWDADLIELHDNSYYLQLDAR